MRVHLGLLVLVSACSFGRSSASAEALLGGVSIDEGAVVVHGPLGSARIALAAIGREDALREVGPAAAELVDGEVRFERAEGVVEWWRDTAAGLEQGVTIQRPADGTGALVLEMSTGALVPQGAHDIELLSADGTRVARYVGLAVLDATGRRVPARMAAHAGRIRIEVDDEDARYPLIVDPLVITEVATLVPPPGSPGGAGIQVAVSSDGRLAVVDSPASFGGVLRTWTRSGMTWSLDAATASGVDGRAPPVLSADGSRLLYRTRVLVRGAGAWTTEASLDVALLGGVSGGALDIVSAAMSADGAWASLGAPSGIVAGLTVGRVRVYSRTGSAWTIAATLSDPTAVRFDEFGSALALSGDGTRLLVGARARDTAVPNAGEVISFTRSGSTWSEDSRWAPPPGESACGGTLATDTSGARVAVMCGRGAGDSGRLYILVRTGTSWVVEHGPIVLSNFAVAVSMDSAGAHVVTGDDTATGSGSTRRGPVHLFVRTGTTWTEQTGIDVPSAGVLWTAAGISPDGTWVVAGAPNENTSGDASVIEGGAHVFTLLEMDGAPCSRDGVCASGRCVDGVCCASTCTGACEACSVSAGGTTDGACTPLSAAAAAAEVCRAAAGPCDVAEVCAAAVAGCPADALATAAAVCRPADPARGCDAPDFCTGTNVSCPMDRPLAAAAPCGTLSGACDVADTCDGVGFDCPDRRAAAGVVCRPVAGLCDVADACDGVSAACPSDGVRPVGQVCGGPGSCRDAAACDGVAAACPATGALRPTGFECAPQLRDPMTGALLPCDLPDLCDGVSELCMPRFAGAGTACGDGTTLGVCDAPDACTGTSADCEPRFLSSIECRASAGACDPAELCLGDSADCPPDQAAPAATVCRASTASCDPAESCDGVSGSCPADEQMCVDTGAAASDAASDAGPDAGPPPVPVEGCRCRAGGRSSPPCLALALLGGLILHRRLPRRGPRSAERSSTNAAPGNVADASRAST